MPLDKKAERELTRIFGDRFSTSLAERLSHSADMGFIPELVWSGIKINNIPDAVVYPVNANEVVELVRVANDYEIPLVPYGRGTNRYGNAVPADGGIVVDFSQMRSVEIDSKEGKAVVEPGVTWKELDKIANQYGFQAATYPSSYDSTVGGGIAGDALGLGSYEHGFVSDTVEEVEFVDPQGELRLVRKGDVAVVAGAEGTTGLITKATIKLKRSSPLVSYVVGVDSFDKVLELIEKFYANYSTLLWHIQVRGPSISNGLIDKFNADLYNDRWNVIFMFPEHRKDLVLLKLLPLFSNYSYKRLNWSGWWTFNHGAIVAFRPRGLLIHQHGLIEYKNLQKLVDKLSQDFGSIGLLQPGTGFDLDIALERREVLLVNVYTESQLGPEDKKIMVELGKNTLMMEDFIEAGGSLLSVGMFAHQYAQNRLNAMGRTFEELGVKRYEMIREFKERYDEKEIMNPGKLLPPKKKAQIVLEIPKKQRLALLAGSTGLSVASKILPGGPNEAYKLFRDKFETFVDFSLKCIDCAMCVTVCPQFQLIPRAPYAPKGLFDFGKGLMSRYFLTGETDVPESDIIELSGCHKCGLCDGVCPADIPITAILFRLSSMVAERVLMEDLTAIDLDKIEEFKKIKDDSSRSGLFIGSLSRSALGQFVTVARILDYIGEKVKLLGTEYSSGFVGYMKGNLNEIRERLEAVSKAVDDLDTLYVASPEDYLMLKEIGPKLAQVGIRPQVQDLAEVLLALLPLAPQKPDEEIVLHLACMSKRAGTNIPRFLELKGFKVKRMEGCSGAVLEKAIGKRADDLAKALGQAFKDKVIVTTCPFAAEKFRSNGVRALSIYEFIATLLGIIKEEPVAVTKKAGVSSQEELRVVLLDALRDVLIETRSQIRDALDFAESENEAVEYLKLIGHSISQKLGGKIKEKVEKRGIKLDTEGKSTIVSVLASTDLSPVLKEAVEPALKGTKQILPIEKISAILADSIRSNTSIIVSSLS